MDYSRSFLYLPQCEPTGQEIEVIRNEDGVVREIHHIRMTGQEHGHCSECNCKTYRHLTRTTELKHFSLSGTLVCLSVEYEINRCPVCGKLYRQSIPFKQKGFRCTQLFYRSVVYMVATCKMTITDVAKAFVTNRNLVRQIDKARLEAAYGEMKPEGVHRFIGIDEFSLHKNHIYATVVIDLESGDVLFLEEGNTEQQAAHFISRAGEAFMKNVKTVAMDMNAQYCKAFSNLCPWIRIVYDGFHIIKNYNDRVLTSLRRSEQNRLLEQIEAAKAARDKETYRELICEYSILKKSNWLLLSNKATLEARDKAAREHNRELYDRYESKGLSIPEGECKWKVTNASRLEQILSSNEKLQTAYVLRTMLQNALSCTSLEQMKDGLVMFIKVARKTRIPELEGVCRMLEKRMDGILSHVLFPISNGPLEGTNNMIKSLRRLAFGYRDTRYFFLKIWDASRLHPKSRSYSRFQQNCA